MEGGLRFETQRLDHLGIVAGISQEIGLIEVIDQQVGSVQCQISCGQAVQAMVLNALWFSSRALYLMPDYLRNKPIDLLIAPGVSVEDFNDGMLGRSLDDLYIAGVTELFAKVASQALAENNQTIPDQKGKPTQVPTMRWVFQVFEGIDVLTIWENDQIIMCQLLKLCPVYIQILHLFGKPIQNCYFLDP